MMRKSIVIDKMVSFAKTHSNVSGLALLGSYARGAFHAIMHTTHYNIMLQSLLC